MLQVFIGQLLIYAGHIVFLQGKMKIKYANLCDCIYNFHSPSYFITFQKINRTGGLFSLTVLLTLKPNHHEQRR